MPSTLAAVAGRAWMDPTAGVDRAPPPRPAKESSRGTVVAAVRTELTTAQASSLLADAVEHVTGEAPSPECTALLTAQWSHETAGGSSMHNYNFAGIKGAGPSGQSAVLRTREGWGDNEVTISDRFRAYGTAEEGARDYVRLLAKRYPDALAAARQGDVTGMVRALKQGGYFTGHEGAYSRNVARLAQGLLPGSAPLALSKVDAPPPIAPPAVASFSSGLAAPAFGAAGGPFVTESALAEAMSRTALSILAGTLTPNPERET